MFAEAFKRMQQLTCDRQHVDKRIAHICETFEDVSPQDAFVINNALSQGLERCFVAMGEAIDSLNPRLGSKALPMIIERVPVELSILGSMVTLIVLGMDGPTQGCDCASCQQKIILNNELDAFEMRVKHELSQHG